MLMLGVQSLQHGLSVDSSCTVGYTLVYALALWWAFLNVSSVFHSIQCDCGSVPTGLCLALSLLDPKHKPPNRRHVVAAALSRAPTTRGCSPSIIHPSSRVTSHKHSVVIWAPVSH